MANDLLKWDGNPQTIRLVSRLQVLSDEFGLNLTCGTMSAAMKYTAPSHETDDTQHERSKPGFFASEEERVQRVRELVGTGTARNPITFLVEASDDIVYSAVDLEDGVKKRTLRWSELEKQLIAAVGKDDPHLRKALQLATDKIGAGFSGQDRDELIVQAFRTYAIIEFVISVEQEFKKEYDSIMSGDYHFELTTRCSAAKFIQACKDIAREAVYKSRDIMTVELTGRRVIQDLLTIFWEGASKGHTQNHRGFEGKAYLLMSANYRRSFEQQLAAIRTGTAKLKEEYLRIQLVCDYIAGMTDSFAADLHRNLTNA